MKFSIWKVLVFLFVFGLLFSLKDSVVLASCLDSGQECDPGFSCQEVDGGQFACIKQGVSIGPALKVNGDQGISQAVNYESLTTFISSSIIPNVMVIANIILFFIILGAGFTIVSSAGNSDKQKQASQTLGAAVLGFIIIFAAYWIMQILGVITGFDLVQ